MICLGPQAWESACLTSHWRSSPVPSTYWEWVWMTARMSTATHGESHTPTPFLSKCFDTVVAFYLLICSYTFWWYLAWGSSVCSFCYLLIHLIMYPFIHSSLLSYSKPTRWLFVCQWIFPGISSSWHVQIATNVNDILRAENTNIYANLVFNTSKGGDVYLRFTPKTTLTWIPLCEFDCLRKFFFCWCVWVVLPVQSFESGGLFVFLLLPAAFIHTLSLFFIETYKLIGVFPSGCVSTHIHTHILTFFFLCSCFLYSAKCQNNSTADSTDINWYVSNKMAFNSKLKWVYCLPGHKASYGFWQVCDFLGYQTGTCMGDTGEADNITVKVHINQIPLHEMRLNAGFNPTH